MSDTDSTPKKEFLTPARLRIMLAASLLVIALAMAGIFSVAQNILRSQAKIVSDASAQSQSSADLVQSLDTTKRQLAKNQSAIERASAVVAESKHYQYQNQIITDLTQFANNNGVTITSISFPTTSGSGTASSSTATPTTPATPTSPAAGGASPTPSGVKSITASIAIKSPVGYANLLNFVNAIQNNLTKMQVSSLSLTSGDGGVSSQTLNIQVYVR